MAPNWGMTKKLFVLSLAVVLSLFHALAMAASARTEAQTKGYVVFNFPTGLPFRVPAVVIRSDTGKRYELVLRQTTQRIPSAGAWVPQGHYVIDQYERQHWTSQDGFDVDAGRITDLGSLLPVYIGMGEFVIAPVRYPEWWTVGEVVRSFGDALKTPDPIEWKPVSVSSPIRLFQAREGVGVFAPLVRAYRESHPEPTAFDRLRTAKRIDEVIALQKEVAEVVTSSEAAVDDEGAMWFPAVLGQVRRRSNDGTWSSSDTGGVNNVSSVEWGRGRLIAARREMLFASEDHGVSWRKLAQLTTAEEVFDIDRIGERWLVASIHREAGTERDPVGWWDAIAVYQAFKDDLSDLALVRRIPFQGRKTIGWGGPFARVAGADYLVSTFLGIERYDTQKGTWEYSPSPKPLSNFNVDPKTGMTTGFRDGMGSILVVSSDHGRTWQKADAPPGPIGNAQFTDPKTARSLKKGSLFGAFAVEVWTMTNGTWSRSTRMPEGCWPIIPDFDNVFCQDGAGSILGFNGRDWVVEFAAE